MAWIQSEVLATESASILDLGCGPGLYTQRLAACGHRCVGIDFAPAAVEYARKQAHEASVACSYRLEDVRTANFGDRAFGLVMMLFGELDVFRPAETTAILAKAHNALRLGGRLLLEVHTPAAVRQMAAGPSWFSAPAGLFGDFPHLCLTESFWHEAESAATRRYYIVDARTGAVTRVAETVKAYSEDEYRALLLRAGFRNVERVPSLLGTDDPEQRNFYVWCAHA